MSELFASSRSIAGASRVRAILVLIALAIAAFAGPAAAEQAQGAGRIVLRVYNVYGVSESALENAHLAVRDVFKAAGIQTVWRDCTGSGDGRCRERPGADEIIVRLIRSPQLSEVSEDQTLGVSLVQSERSRGSYMSLYPDRVDLIAERFGRDHDLLLGRAIAHELGHLLLGMTAHAPTGLMRARWSERPLQASVPGDWIFSSAEARQLRDAVRARAAGTKPVDRLATISAAPMTVAKTFTTH